MFIFTKILFSVFLNSIDMLNLMSEKDPDFNEKKQKKNKHFAA